MNLNWKSLEQSLSGSSIIDFSNLSLTNKNDAKLFLQAYGYNPEDPHSKEEIWRIYFESIAFIKTELLNEKEFIPESFFERNSQTDVVKLLIEASHPERDNSQWACAILRVMHIISHLDNDVRTEYFQFAKEQITSRFEKFLHKDSNNRYIAFGESLENSIPIRRFFMKARKARNSTIIKLLTKANSDIASIYDSIGFRFVTDTRLEALGLLEKLFELGVISKANLQPGRSINSIINFKSLGDVIAKFSEDGKIHTSNQERLMEVVEDLPFPNPENAKNPYSSSAYRAIQITGRQMIEAPDSSFKLWERVKKEITRLDDYESFIKTFPVAMKEFKKFFYPFELQILDKKSYADSIRGKSRHSKYKSRQRSMARQRVLKGIYT